jgi:DNA-binding HxlR family transcriptional regulator
MRSKGFEGMACSIAEVMGAIGDRWGILVMRDLLLGLTRYDDLRRSTAITNATLSDRLKSLEQSGLIERRRYQERPKRYEYVPTGRGRDIALLMQAMVQIGDKWRREEKLEPPIRFVNAESGNAVKLATVEEGQTEFAQGSGIRILPGPGADDLMRWRMAQGEDERAGQREAKAG